MDRSAASPPLAIVIDHRRQLGALLRIEIRSDEIADSGALRRSDRVPLFAPDPDLGGPDGARREVRSADLRHLLRVVNEQAQVPLVGAGADPGTGDLRARGAAPGGP